MRRTDSSKASDASLSRPPGLAFRSGILITSFQAQTRSGHHLKKRKASSHPQTQTGIRLVWTSPACRPKSQFLPIMVTYFKFLKSKPEECKRPRDADGVRIPRNRTPKKKGHQMENEIETQVHLKVHIRIYRDITPAMENQMERTWKMTWQP